MGEKRKGLWPGKDQLAFWRTSRGLSHKTLGKEIGKSAGAVQHYEKGGWPKADVLKRLKALGFELNLQQKIAEEAPKLAPQPSPDLQRELDLYRARLEQSEKMFGMMLDKVGSKLDSCAAGSESTRRTASDPGAGVHPDRSQSEPSLAR